MKTNLSITFITVIFFLSPFLIIESVFKSKSSLPFKSTSKVWAHRVNSYKRLTNVLKYGFEGIEIDLHFSNGHFYISHDQEGIKDNITLKQFLEHVPQEISIWFDLKNLQSSNVFEVEKSYLELDKIFSILNRSFIESRNGYTLSSLASNGINTLFWINPHNNSTIFHLRNISNKLIIATSNFIGVSTSHEGFSNRTLSTYSHLSLFTFTVNNDKKISELKKNDKFKVILTDRSRAK